MPLRLRKFIGAIALFVLVDRVGAGGHGAGASSRHSRPRALSVAYYVIAGIGWVLPAMPIVAWMSRKRGG